MQTRGSWARWALLANGLLVALLGAAFLFAEFVLPHIVVATERAQGIELYDPRVGGDPLLAQPHAFIRPLIATLFVVTGTAHLLTGIFRRRLSDGVLVPLTALGMLSFVPTSIVLGLVTLAALLREGERGGMKVVIPGGTGAVGRVLARALAAGGHEAVILSRSADGRNAAGAGARTVQWDARTVGAWARELDGADAVVNLAGRSVSCRYTRENLAAMLSSRVESTRAVGLAIAEVARPPRVWLQMSTATIYAHRFDAPNDEATGRIGGDEPDVPAYWRTSIDIARAWEQAQSDTPTPHTRKLALRTAMVMSPDRGSVLDVLLGLVRRGLGGPIAGGRQFMSWIHERDFARAVSFLIAREDLDGAVNLAAPSPLPQRAFMAALREASGTRLGLPAAKWMVGIGAYFLRTDPELVLKSRRVTPGRLLEAGFAFDFPEWPDAARDLVAAWRAAGPG